MTNPEDFDGDYEGYLWSLELSHKPLRPPRPGFIGECVYAEKWEELMATPPSYGEPIPGQRLADIQSNLPRWITQRDATIAASLITWIGTNCGRSVPERAKRLESANVLSGEAAYRAIWAAENTRYRSVNSGFRILEYLLSPPDHYGTSIITGLSSLVRRPEISVDDYESADNVAAWLGSNEGKTFVDRCEKRIADLQRVEDNKRRLQLNAQRTSVSADPTATNVQS